MSAPLFLVVSSDDPTNGENWLIAWTGCDTALRHWDVTTNHIHGSELHSVSRGPEGDARLIAMLLNWYYSGPERAENKMLADAVSDLKEATR